MSALKGKGGRKPTFVVELDDKCIADHLMSLFVE